MGAALSVYDPIATIETAPRAAVRPPPCRSQRAANHLYSDMVIGGMAILLGTCHCLIDSAEGAVRAVAWVTGLPWASQPMISPARMASQFGARRLHPWDCPALFQMLRDLCWRARLPTLPDLYYLPDPHAMNAYAFGGPEFSAITLTEGLLCRMTGDEIAAILAHEIGHVRNNDGRRLSLAAALEDAIARTARCGRAGQRSGALGLLLALAPAIGRILHMTLSRLREFDADAVAMDLADDSRTLVAALLKLEHYHGGRHAAGLPDRADDILAYILRSHPETWERVAHLQGRA